MNTLYAFDYFIQLDNERNNQEKNMFTSHYKTLKELFNDSPSDSFAQHNIVNCFYSKIKSQHIKISELTSDQKLSQFIFEYNKFSEEFSYQFKDEINYFINTFSEHLNVSDIVNINELISYVIVESLVELSNTKIKFIPNNNTENKSFSQLFNQTFFNAKNDIDIITELENKPFGFYIFKVPYQNMTGSSFNVSGSICIASHQSNGITLFNLNDNVLNRYGLKGNALNLQNIYNKSHNLDIQFKDNNSHEISINNETNDFKKLDLINQLIFISFFSLCSLEERRNIYEKENKSLISINKNNQKSLLPVVSKFSNIDTPQFTFEELRFKDEYAFLSPLDDLFEHIIDMDIVNYTNDKTDCYFMINMNTIDNEDSQFGNYFKKTFEPTLFNKEHFNQFYIKEVDHNMGQVGVETSMLHITPLKSSFIGSEEEIYQNAMTSAKMNKLTLYYLYFSFYNSIYQQNLVSEMKQFFTQNINDIIQDDNFISLIKSFGFCKNNKTNQKNFVNQKTIFSSSQNINNENLKDYTGKNKALFIANLYLDSSEMFDVLFDKYHLNLTESSQNIIDISLNFITLYNKYNELNIKNKSRRVFFSYIQNEVDIELQEWFQHQSILPVSIPLTNKQKISLEEKILNFGIEIQNNNYSNGHRFFDNI